MHRELSAQVIGRAPHFHRSLIFKKASARDGTSIEPSTSEPAKLRVGSGGGASGGGAGVATGAGGAETIASSIVGDASGLSSRFFHIPQATKDQATKEDAKRIALNRCCLWDFGGATKGAASGECLCPHSGQTSGNPQ
ncbi:MAG: hypothetical protein ACREVK_00185 [Gammaproteobacteria bacterium]